MKIQSGNDSGPSADRLLREALRMFDAPELDGARSSRREQRLRAMARRRFAPDVDNLTSNPDTGSSAPESGAVIVGFKPRFEAGERRECNAS